MKENYDDCLNRVLKSEGGYTNDPRDPGGPTNFGITIHDYRSYVNPKGTAVDVKRMKLDDAKKIYKAKYWDKVNGDTLPSGVDYTVFDYGVNSGVSRANRVYTKLKQADSIRTINAINDERLHFLRSLSTYNHFGLGWSRRVSAVRSHSIDLAREIIPITPKPKQPVKLPPIPSGGQIKDQVDTWTSIITTLKNFFKDNFATNITVAGGVVSSLFTHDWPYILAGAVVVSGLLWLGIHLYERK